MAMKKTAEKKTAPETPTTKEEKLKAIETAIAQIEKAYGAGAVMRLGQNTTMNVESIPTGSMTLDMALGIGGVPRGRIVESTVPNPPVRQRLPCISWLRLRSGAERSRL